MSAAQIAHTATPFSAASQEDPCGFLYSPVESVFARAAHDVGLMQELLLYARPASEFLVRLSKQPLILSRSVATPNYETLRFLDLCEAAGARPMLLERRSDWFTPSVNESKRRLGKLRILSGPDAQNPLQNVSIVPFDLPGKVRFSDLRCHDGGDFMGFHHQLLTSIAGPEVLDGRYDDGRFTGLSSPRDYYERLFALLTVWGVLAESFQVKGSEGGFVEKVVIPSFETIRERFGLAPRLVRLLPVGREEDPCWESYPPEVLPLCQQAARRPARAPPG